MIPIYHRIKGWYYRMKGRRYLKENPEDAKVITTEIESCDACAINGPEDLVGAVPEEICEEHRDKLEHYLREGEWE